MITNENAPKAGRPEANFETTFSQNNNQDQADSQADSIPLLCSGYGQFHTDEPGKDNRKPYAQINFKGIQSLVDTPQKIDKQLAQWLIPSTLLSRTFKEQEARGVFWMLWADIDQATKPLIEIAEIIDSSIPDCDYEIYTSKSATQDNQKCRILIPLNKPLSGSDWVFCQQILNDKLESNGIIPDRASERPAQLCYLPNRGEYYDRKSKRNGAFFNPSLEWANEIKNTQDEIVHKAAELERLSSEGKSKREELKLNCGTKSSALPDLISSFNQAHTVQDILLQAGFVQRGDTFRHPHSESGSYSASVKNGRVHSLSSNDPLFTGGGGGGAHDAFSAFTVLFHAGNRNAALRDAGDKWVMNGSEPWNKEYDQQKVKVAFSPNCNSEVPPIDSILDSDVKYSNVDLLQYVDDGHIIKRLSLQIAEETDLPPSTVFLAILGVFSSVAVRRYSVLYKNNDPLPIGLYVVTEQPSGSGKSRCLKISQNPFYKISKEIHDDIKSAIAVLKGREKRTQEEEDQLKVLNARLESLQPIFTTNTTSEGLEKQLAKSNGFFSCVSSEQGLFNVLFGGAYKGDSKVNNNDVALNGFDGGYINSSRVTREGYCGNVAGGIVCFAQTGSIETLLNSSNGTGLSERFLMLAEPHSLGKRNHLKEVVRDPAIVLGYAKKCDSLKDVIESPRKFDDLPGITISDSGFLKIKNYLNTIEKDLADGGKFSHTSLRGAAAKVDMQVMKIAANLYLTDRNGDEPLYIIDDKYIDSAIAISNALLEANLKLCQNKGVMGIKAEFNAIIVLFEDNPKPRIERALIQSRSKVSPFKEYSGNKSQLIRNTLNEMVKQRLLAKTTANGSVSYCLC
ncbi:uncharacterized protein DUF3987 [Nitrosomonas ureae]|uniref:DUF3987 domain-containing protein n=1 Tax=Nitrosomonas ureae TaxID=44577 RepID=UPI000D766128|nr:DUF3987 domain-containing protein [Nitrosomonas ureae]PXX14775.1 uncharacterized protein DUF3987 [Nitrosomonas ureae]